MDTCWHREGGERHATQARRAEVTSRETLPASGTSRCRPGMGGYGTGSRSGPQRTGTVHLVTPLTTDDI